MITLFDFRAQGLSITWKLIDIGFLGSEAFQHELSAAAIMEYAIARIEANEADDLDLIGLAGESENDLDGIGRHIQALAQKEQSDYSTEWRKWQVVYVAQCLPPDDVEYVSGLIALGDIWVRLGFPSDSPHIFQGKDNDSIPEQYYTEENYLALLRGHIDWVAKEMNCLREVSKPILSATMS